jgi:hypothetical protein
MKTIEENNRLIAEFMAGYTVETHHNQYHESWNELIPVVSKCRAESNSEDSHWEVIYYTLEECDIVITYQAVVQFIEWYNENK